MTRAPVWILVAILANIPRSWPAPSPIEPETPGVVERREPIKPIPLDVTVDARKAALGKALFYERRLSHNDTIACATCHDIRTGGADGLTHSIGMNAAEGAINAPTVFNSGFNFRQFWDGRAATLEAQIDGPIQNPQEMASSWEQIVAKLRAIPRYTKQFREIFPDGIEPRNIKEALAEFERSLTTPNSRFDKFLRGDQSSITEAEKEGYRKFKSIGCASCHQGVNAGGNMFATLGAMADYFGDRGHIEKADYGRFNVTGREEDRFVFKVPSLRNVALTAPYFHDGSAPTLEAAVVIMGRYQLGRQLSPGDVGEIAAFLRSLTGEYQGRPL